MELQVIRYITEYNMNKQRYNKSVFWTLRGSWILVLWFAIYIPDSIFTRWPEFRHTVSVCSRAYSVVHLLVHAHCAQC